MSALSGVFFLVLLLLFFLFFFLLAIECAGYCLMPVSSKSGIEEWFWLTENFHSERLDLLPVSVRLRDDKSDFKQDVVQRRSSNV